MSADKYIPKAGDVVAVLDGKSILRGEVRRVMKRFVDVSTHPTRSERRFYLPYLTEVGRAVYGVFGVPTIEPWTEEHAARRAQALAIARLRRAAQDLLNDEDVNDTLCLLPTHSLDEAGAILRALMRDAKAAYEAKS